MDRKSLLGAVAALAVACESGVAFGASDDARSAGGNTTNSATSAAGQAAGGSGTAASTTEDAAAAGDCLEDLTEVEQAMNNEGRVVDGGRLRTLHEAAQIFADSGMDDACEEVVEGIRAYGEQTAERGVMNDEQRSAYQQRLANAKPIEEMPGRFRASELMNDEVVTLEGESIGDIDDVMIAPDGGERYVLIGTGGVFGVGEDYVPVALNRLRVVDDDTLALAVEPGRFEEAPHVDVDDIDERIEGWTRDVDDWWNRNIGDQNARAR